MALVCAARPLDEKERCRVLCTHEQLGEVDRAIKECGYLTPDQIRTHLERETPDIEGIQDLTNPIAILECDLRMHADTRIYVFGKTVLSEEELLRANPLISERKIPLGQMFDRLSIGKVAGTGALYTAQPVKDLGTRTAGSRGVENYGVTNFYMANEAWYDFQRVKRIVRSIVRFASAVPELGWREAPRDAIAAPPGDVPAAAPGDVPAAPPGDVPAAPPGPRQQFIALGQQIIALGQQIAAFEQRVAALEGRHEKN
jgi:hypothetical protein